jgi:hypothetical protein
MLRTGAAVRRADERGLTETDWLRSRHSFSFAEYHDERHMGLGPLRVLNDDIVQPRSGFGPHPHRDMEIVTCVLAGAVQHEDSMGNRHVIRAGESQFLRAGTGIVHGETNPFDEPVRFLQVWFVPRTRGLAPRYDQRALAWPEKGAWATVASPGLGGHDIDSDAVLLAARLAPGARAGHVVHGGRQAYAFVAEGEVGLGSERLRQGDAALVRDGVVGLRAEQASQVLLFDLPLL